MKKEIISLVLQILCAVSCAVASISIDKDFTSITYVSCAVLWGVISGMTLHELLTKNK